MPNLEYQCPEDEAWYEVSIEYGEKEGASYFEIHYTDSLPEGEVEIVELRDSVKVNETIKRLRRYSKQLQESECRKVKEGLVVCAAHHSNDGRELKFFDAVVKKAVWSPHTKESGQVKCRCTSNVLWKEGPSKGERANVKPEEICLLILESVESDPEIQFLQRALEENNRRAEEAGDVLNSSNVTVTNDNELRSSVKIESDVGSSHEAASTSLSGLGNRVPNVLVEAPALDLNQRDGARVGSSVKIESDVGSSHEAASTALSGSGNSVPNVLVEAPVLDLNQRGGARVDSDSEERCDRSIKLEV